MSNVQPPTPSAGTARGKPPPNYAARRMLVTTVAVTAIIAFGVIGWQVVRGDDDEVRSGGGAWSEIAVVDRATGAITLLDPDGAETDTTVGRGRVVDLHAYGDRLALIGATQILVTGGDIDPVSIPIDRTASISPIHTANALHLVIGNPTGGNVEIIDVATGDVLNIGDLAEQTNPLLFAETVRWSADASAFAVADAANFQTILVEPGATTATFFPDQPVALNAERIATSQVVGQQADIALFDRERKNQALVPTPIPAGGVMIDNDLIMAATDGSIYLVAGGQEEADRLGQVAVPSGATVASIHPTFDGQRLVVAGPVFVAVIDLDGKTIFTTTFTTPIDIEAPMPGWTCLPVGGGDTYHSLITLETGEQLADLSGVEVTGVAEDGCTLLGERNGVAEVISTEESIVIGRVRSAELGPDGRSLVRTSTSGKTELVTINDDYELDEPTDLSDLTTPNAIIAFLQS